jgi:hypothetical protein
MKRKAAVPRRSARPGASREEALNKAGALVEAARVAVGRAPESRERIVAKLARDVARIAAPFRSSEAGKRRRRAARRV